jgi:hypothetical protein
MWSFQAWPQAVTQVLLGGLICALLTLDWVHTSTFQSLKGVVDKDLGPIATCIFTHLYVLSLDTIIWRPLFRGLWPKPLPHTFTKTSLWGEGGTWKHFPLFSLSIHYFSTFVQGSLSNETIPTSMLTIRPLLGSVPGRIIRSRGRISTFACLTSVSD